MAPNPNDKYIHSHTSPHTRTHPSSTLHVEFSPHKPCRTIVRGGTAAAVSHRVPLTTRARDHPFKDGDDCALKARLTGSERGLRDLDSPLTRGVRIQEQSNILDRGVKGLDYSGRTSEQVHEVVSDLIQWVKAHTVDRARDLSLEHHPKYTLLECATGGCLDALAALFAGFRHLGGSEDVESTLGAAKGRLFVDLTGAPCLGDARRWRDWVTQDHYDVDYYKSGMPCPDYTSLGSKEGNLGKKGGDLFTGQIDLILTITPKVVGCVMPNVRSHSLPL